MRAAAIILVLISTILQLQAEPTPEKTKEYVVQPPLLDDDTCIKMTEARETEINHIVKELTEFIDSLAEKHEFFDLRLVKLDIDKYSEAEDDDTTTVLELFVNDCAKNADVDDNGADNGNYDAIKSLDDASNGDKSSDGKNIASHLRDTSEIRQNDLTSETYAMGSKTNIKSLKQSNEVIKNKKNKFASNVNKINITRRVRRKDKSNKKTNINSEYSKDIESKTNYEEKIAAVNNESEKILDSITQAIQKYENDSKKISANNLNVNSINSQSSKITENINGATNKQSTIIKNVEEQTTVNKSVTENNNSQIVQNVQKNNISEDQAIIQKDSTSNVKSTTSNISENVSKISSKESDKWSSVKNNVKQSTNNIKNINQINDSSSTKFFREHDIRSSANDININKRSNNIVRSTKNSGIDFSDDKSIENNVISSINNVENQSQSTKKIGENVSNSRTSQVSSINNIKNTSESNINQNKNTSLNKNKQVSAKSSNNKFQSEDKIEDINYDKNSFSEQQISKNTDIDPNNYRRSDNDDYIDDGKNGGNSVNDDKFYDAYDDNEELPTDDNSSTANQRQTTVNDKNSVTANIDRKYNKNQRTNQSVGSRSKFDINESRLVNSLKNIIRQEITSVYNEKKSISNEKHKPVDCGLKNVDDVSLWDDDFEIKSKPQIVFLDLEDKALELLNLVNKNKCKKSPWLMYLQVDYGRQQVIFL